MIGGLRLDGRPVAIKPNVCVEQDVSGCAVTSIDLVKAVVDEVLKNKEVAVSIVESDSDGKWLNKAYENHGYTEMVDGYCSNGFDVSLVNLSKEPWVEVSSAYCPSRLRLPKMLLEPVYFISVAKAKTHSLTDLTGVLKNQFGCISIKNKSVYHDSIDEVIAEVNSRITPDLCVVDAVKGMEGVIRGRIRDIGVLITGHAPASTDSVLARVMGFDAGKVGHIATASRRGLGSLNPPVAGVPVAEVAIEFRKPSKLVRTVGRHIPEPFYGVARSAYGAFNRARGSD